MHDLALGAILVQIGDEVGEVVVELAEIADVAARARGAMPAIVDRDGGDRRLGERLATSFISSEEADEPCARIAIRPVSAPSAA